MLSSIPLSATAHVSLLYSRAVESLTKELAWLAPVLGMSVNIETESATVGHRGHVIFMIIYIWKQKEGEKKGEKKPKHSKVVTGRSMTLDSHLAFFGRLRI